MVTNPVTSVLVISLSNIGDVILTFPVMDSLLAAYPGTALDVVIGPKAEGLLRHVPAVSGLHIFHKHQGLIPTLRWLGHMRQKRYDVIVDLRNTAIPFFLRAGRRTSPFLQRRPGHMRDQHLNRLRRLLIGCPLPDRRFCWHATDTERQAVDDMLIRSRSPEKPFVVIAPGAADQAKRWDPVRFAELADRITDRYAADVVLIGDRHDREVVRRVAARMRTTARDLSGRLNLPQVGYVLQKSCLLIGNDTAPQHLASYLDTPVIALFGPTDPERYGPWGKDGFAVHRKDTCAACRGVTGARHSCLDAVTVDDVLNMFGLERGQAVFKRPVPKTT